MAGAVDWKLHPENSRIEFVATQQGAKFRGRFTRFSTIISLDPAAPERGRIEAFVEPGSVDSANSERDEYLRGADWFAVERWPEASFVSSAIRRDDDHPEMLIAEGQLRLRDKCRPVLFRFQLEPGETRQTLHLAGQLVISRLDFGVGQGLWVNTDWVGDSVAIDVDLALVLP